MKGYEEGIVIIKPECFLEYKKILRDFDDNDIKCISIIKAIVTKDIIHLMSHNRDPNIKEEYDSYMLGKNIVILHLYSINYVKRIIEIVGHHFDPLVCGQNTLRHKYFKGYEGKLCLNGIHRPFTNEENKRMLNFFYTYHYL